MACGERAATPKGRELETVEVPGAIDQGLSLAGDVQAKPVGKRATGVVPSDFPSDFPIYSPSAVVDFGSGFVEFTSIDPRSVVESGLAASARAAGWRAEGGGRYRKGDRTVTASLGSISGVTTLRLEY